MPNGSPQPSPPQPGSLNTTDQGVGWAPMRSNSRIEMTHAFHFRWEGQNNSEATDLTYNATSWSSVLNRVKTLSGDENCALEGCYHAGGRHIIQRVVVPSKQISWIIRIPIIPIISDFTNSIWWTKEHQLEMESEIATMIHVADNTDIPVPLVYDYNTRITDNPVGLPYLLMQCIQGNMLFDLGGPKVLTPQQQGEMWRSIASFQRQLANASINKIGRLALDTDRSITIGPLPQTFGFEGPFNNPADYFMSWIRHNSQFQKPLENPELRQATESFPRRLQTVVHKLTTIKHITTGRYPIIHPDFGLHNILFNEDFGVVGVIDWEGAYSAPLEVFTSLTTMDVWIEPTKPGLCCNADYLKELEMLEGDDTRGVRLSEAFNSMAGLLGFCMRLFQEGRALRFDEIMNKIEKGL